MTWKDKFCDTCFYQVDRCCRKLPVTIEGYYPLVTPTFFNYDTLKYENLKPLPACAEYKETNESHSLQN